MPAYRELDDALGLTNIAGQHLVDGRTGKNGRHDLSVCRASPYSVGSPDMKTSTTPTG
jgi:hypothetical protein